MGMSIISLKPAVLSDYEDYYVVRSSPGDIFWNGYEKKPNKESFFQIFQERLGDKRLEKPEDRRIYLVKLTEADNTRIIGFLQLIKRVDGVDISYTIIEEYQGRGFATQALQLGIEQARQVGCQIYVQIRDDNIASQKVAVKCGFVPTNEVVVNTYPAVGQVNLRKYRLFIPS